VPYATALDMVTAFGHADMRDLSDIGEPRIDDVNQVVLGRALADASAMIDGYLVGRYQLPLSPVPEVLRVHCRGLARYLLMTNMPDERAKTDFKAAIDYLKLIASGTVNLQPPAAPGQVPAGMGPVVFEPGQKVFAREDL
jgi:phage gp36-like protein